MQLATTQMTDQLTALAVKPLALAYGRHVVAGNVVLRDDDAASGLTTLFIGLGEGEWDAVENLKLNALNLTDNVDFHFHPGKPGEPGGGGVSGDQKIDAWFPPSLTQTNFSDTAYVVIRSANDVESPVDEFLPLGVYRGKKVKTFDSVGVELSFAYSANPVWIALDLLLKKEPTSRIEFASFAAEAAFADETLNISGVDYARFECHVAFTDKIDVGRALQAVLNTCRGFLFDDGGKISIRLDQARSASHAFTMANVARGSFRCWLRDIRSATNRLRLKFRDLENDFAISSIVVERTSAQTLTGKVNEKELDLGNTYQQQAERIGEYWMTRATDDLKMLGLGGFQDSVHLLPGDRVDVEHDLAPWDGPKAFEVIEVTDAAGDGREFLLQEYDANAFIDAAQAPTMRQGGVIVAPTNLPAGKVGNPSASENKFVSPVDGTIWSRVTVSWDAPAPAGTFRGVEIWGQRLDGVGDPIEPLRFFEKFEESPGFFLTEPTGDDLKLFLVSFNTFGRLNNKDAAPNVTVTPDAAPPPTARFPVRS